MSQGQDTFMTFIHWAKTLLIKSMTSVVYCMYMYVMLTHWGRVTHICVGKLTIIGSDNGLSPGRRLAIIWNNAGILSIGPLGKNFNDILIRIQIFSFKKLRFKLSSAKWRQFCPGLNVLISLLVLKPEYSGRSRSISCLLISWFNMSPCHQQPWY